MRQGIIRITKILFLQLIRHDRIMHLHGKPSKKFPIPRIILGNTVLSLFLILSFMRGQVTDLNSFLIAFFWTFSISITQWMGIELIYGMLDRHISWIHAPIKKSIALVFSFLVYSAPAFMAVHLLNFYIWRGMNFDQAWPYIIRSLPASMLVSVFLSLLFTATGFFKAWKQSFIQGEKLKAEMLSYKYESLRNQLNPHFLFNSLNVLSDLVYDDQALAVRFIRQLSDLFRYVLDSRDKEVVPLSEELAFIQSYIFLLKTRFEEKLKINIEVSAENDDYIVPMTIQLLIENAVKHNELSEAFPLRLSISRKGDYLEIENTLKRKNVGDDSKGTGLQNIRQQFAFLTDLPVEIFPTEQKYLVRVPILKTVQK